MAPALRAVRALSVASAALSTLGMATAHAQAVEPMTFTSGAAQVVARGGVGSLTDMALASGTLDAGRGRMQVRYETATGDGFLTISTPATPASYSTAKRGQGASVRYEGIGGMKGARGGCAITWRDIAPSVVSGSFACPRERAGGRRAPRVAVGGTFVAGTPGPTSPLDGVPVYPVGVAVEAAGQRITPLAFTDIDLACATAKGAATEPCPPGSSSVEAPFRAVELEACVTLSGQPGRPLGRDGYGGALFAGDPDAPVPLGVPASPADPAITSISLVGVALDEGMCVTGHALSGIAGPVAPVVPRGGRAGRRVDPRPGPVAPDRGWPAGRIRRQPLAGHGTGRRIVTFASGFADVTHDGEVTGSADDLSLTDGSLETRDDGTAQLHLRFASPTGSTVAIDLPGGPATYPVPAGSIGPDLAVSYSVGGASVEPGDANCTVDVAATETGGITGTWVCDGTAGGTGSGSFFANP